jgi:hypothetical protein
MKRKLSTLEHVICGNIVYLVRLEGCFTLDQFRSALTRVQRKHPALRSLIREEKDGLYFEEDSAPEIPLRIVPRVSENDYRRECQTELANDFVFGQPHLRVVWLHSESESDLLLTTTHRICDGMSMLTLVREILRALHSDEDLVPYEPITVQDFIGDYQHPQPRKQNLVSHLTNGLMRLIPNSRRPLENREISLEWSADGTLLSALKHRCKVEGVSLNTALMVALDRVMFTVFGEKKLPKWLDTPMDIRRGRVAALKSDMVYFSGGNLKVRTGQSLDVEFWTRARTVNEELREQIEQEILNIPKRFHSQEMLHPPTGGQVQTIVRWSDALKMNGSWNHFALSNLGNVVVSDNDAPFKVKDLRLYLHSFNFRLLGLVTYTIHKEMRFYLVGDEKCLSHSQANQLKHEFMNLLERQAS